MRTDGGDFVLLVNDSRGARPHVECEVGGRDPPRLSRPEKDASDSAGELVRVPVCALGRDAEECVRGALVIGGVA